MSHEKAQPQGPRKLLLTLKLAFDVAAIVSEGVYRASRSNDVASLFMVFVRVL